MQWFTVLVALYPLWWAIKAVHCMTKHTSHRVRIGAVLIGASAFGLVLAPLYTFTHDWLSVALLAGMSVFLSADRRVR